MPIQKRCNSRINVNNKYRYCKKNASINGKCMQHYKKYILDGVKQAYGICCFCGYYCNPCSQACGKCCRML